MGILDLVGDNLGTIGQVASAAGQVSQLFGGGNKEAGTTKIASRPIEESISDIEKLRQYLASNRQTVQVPTRRLTAAEMADDTFSPKGVMALQKALDERRQMQSRQADNMGATGQASTQQPQVLYNTQQTGNKSTALTGRLAEMGALKGWNPKTQTYTTTDPTFGSIVTLSGQEGYRAAEEAALRDIWKQRNPNSAEAVGSMYATKLNPRMPNFTGRETGFINPQNGLTYDRDKAINAFLDNDEEELLKQREALIVKTPKRGFGALLPKLVAGLLAAPVAAGAGAVIGGATGSTALGSAAKYGTKYLTNKKG